MCGLILPRESRGARRRPDDRERLLPGKPAAAVAEEERPAVLDRRVAQLEQQRPGLVEPAPEPVDRDVADRHEPLAIALPDDPDEAAVEREVLDVESRRLADPEARGVEQLEQRPCPQVRGAASRSASTSSTVSVSGSRRGWRGRSMCWATSTRIRPSP